MRTINYLIIHCSATPEGVDYTIDDISRWHRSRGFSSCGYHYVIYRDGTVVSGRPLSSKGAHCVGHNHDSIGICYIGGLSSDCKTPKDTRTPAQKSALLNLLIKLRKEFPFAVAVGHREFANKACPCFDVRHEYSALGFCPY